jgi:hypothetical protein
MSGRQPDVRQFVDFPNSTFCRFGNFQFGEPLWLRERVTENKRNCIKRSRVRSPANLLKTFQFSKFDKKYCTKNWFCGFGEFDLIGSTFFYFYFYCFMFLFKKLVQVSKGFQDTYSEVHFY